MTMYSATVPTTQSGFSAARLGEVCWRGIYATASSEWHTIREWRRRSRSGRELRMLSELERRGLAYGYGEQAYKSFWQAGMVSLGTKGITHH